MTAGRVFISDCEGPIAINDFAFEVAHAFIPRGDHLFAQLSRYDDVLADVVKRPGYRAGTTLTLVTPFLKAYGVTNAQLLEYAADTLVVLPGAKEMLHHPAARLPTFIVSTSYEQYLAALCTRLDFPRANVYCTSLDLDRYTVPAHEATRLRDLADEIASHPMIHSPDHASALQDLDDADRATITKLDAVFGTTIPGMTCGRMLEEITPMGGEGKATAVRTIASQMARDLAEVVYVGDSITDVQAFQLVTAGGGLAIAFNGNRYAVANAEIAVLSDTALVTALLVDVFSRRGKQAVLDLSRNWSRRAVEEAPAPSALIAALLDRQSTRLPHVHVVEDANVEAVIEESSRVRRRVRGEAIGRLG
jgi:energy-converting hydrogenase A subunit R